MSTLMERRADGVRVLRKRRPWSWRRGAFAGGIVAIVAISVGWWRFSPLGGLDVPPGFEPVENANQGIGASAGGVPGPEASQASGRRLRVRLGGSGEGPVADVKPGPGTGQTSAEHTPVVQQKPEEAGQDVDTDTTEEGVSGIALFPPPGTNPPKSGLIVPDDFDLPPGYVRHYQVTDDGKPLPPILMFHPDAELYDEEGNRIPLPPDLVVPPELAPPGFPKEILQVPEQNVPFFEPPPSDAVSAPPEE